MPSLNVSVPHALERDEAAQRLRGFLEQVKAQYGSHLSNLEEEWAEHEGTFRFSAMGFKTSGTLAVELTEVRISGSLPLAAIMFRGKIEEAIREHLTRVLS